TVELEGSEKSSEKSSEKIQSLMRRNPLATIQEIAIDLGVSTRAIEKQIMKLKKAGLITRIGPDKGGHWKVRGKT
ncbi:MAG: HTH domain-containing protein, partial [Deltaproteobacteria bacterium]|nr:HTH domain-containing protein [Deltaproteobacteria bacterium]